MHFQGSIEGRGVGEFPIIYFLNACIWKITSPNYITFRLINLIIVFLGLLCLFKTALFILKDFFWACAIPLILISSPLFAYYSNNFLVNVPALSFIFIAWYFLTLFSSGKKMRYLWFSVVFMALSFLLRPSMIIAVTPVFLLLFLELFGLLKSNIFYKKTIHLPVLLLPVVISIAWILFSKHYNEVNNSEYFLTTIRPSWKAENVEHIWSQFYNVILPVFHFPGMLFIITTLLIGMMVTWKKQNKYFLIFTLTLSLELIFYIMLWFENLDVHDYYLIELFLIIAPLFIGFLLFLKNENPHIFYSKKIKILVFIVLLFFTYSCAIKVRIKYNVDHPIFGTHIVLSEEEIKYWEYIKWDNDTRYKAYETVTPYIRSLGINRKDIVVSITDPSPNISLSLMDQKGFTSLYYTDMSEDERIRMFIQRGAKYLFINDPKLYENPKLADFTKNKIGQFMNIDIYDLRGVRF
ncbi:MAG TPA: glycosyltransferase family 39 protein [Bacteroidales bacterium]|nr:glycosyltransferase family 39 protein [Bacteroidales bacterium]